MGFVIVVFLFDFFILRSFSCSTLHSWTNHGIVSTFEPMNRMKKRNRNFNAHRYQKLLALKRLLIHVCIRYDIQYFALQFGVSLLLFFLFHLCQLQVNFFRWYSAICDSISLSFIQFLFLAFVPALLRNEYFVYTFLDWLISNHWYVVCAHTLYYL